MSSGRVVALYRPLRIGGFTVAELSVVMFLLSLLLVLLALFFSKGQNFFADTDAYSTLQRETSVALRKICDPLRRSTVAYLGANAKINPGDNPSSLWFLSYAPTSLADAPVEFGGGARQIRWKRWIGFYHLPDKSQVVRVDIPLTNSSPMYGTSSTPSPALSYTKLVGAPITGVVGRHIVEMSVAKAGKIVSVSLVGRSESPVTQRRQEDKVLEIRVFAQVFLPD